MFKYVLYVCERACSPCPSIGSNDVMFLVNFLFPKRKRKTMRLDKTEKEFEKEFIANGSAKITFMDDEGIRYATYMLKKEF